MSGLEVLGVLLGLYPRVAHLAKGYKLIKGGEIDPELRRNLVVASTNLDNTVKGSAGVVFDFLQGPSTSCAQQPPDQRNALGRSRTPAEASGLDRGTKARYCALPHVAYKDAPESGQGRIGRTFTWKRQGKFPRPFAPRNETDHFAEWPSPL